MLLRDMVEEALAGNWHALKTVFRTLAPPRRTSPILMEQLFDVDALTSSAEAARASNRIPVLIAKGVLSPSEGREFLAVLDRIEAKLRTAEYQASQREREKKEAEQRRALLGPIGQELRQDRKAWASGTAWPSQPPKTPGAGTTPPPVPSAPAGSSAAPDSGPPPSRPRDGAESSAARS